MFAIDTRTDVAILVPSILYRWGRGEGRGVLSIARGRGRARAALDSRAKWCLRRLPVRAGFLRPLGTTYEYLQRWELGSDHHGAQALESRHHLQKNSSILG